jgi:hypothetical protein
MHHPYTSTRLSTGIAGVTLLAEPGDDPATAPTFRHIGWVNYFVEIANRRYACGGRWTIGGESKTYEGAYFAPSPEEAIATLDLLVKVGAIKPFDRADDDAVEAAIEKAQRWADRIAIGAGIYAPPPPRFAVWEEGGELWGLGASLQEALDEAREALEEPAAAFEPATRRLQKGVLYLGDCTERLYQAGIRSDYRRLRIRWDGEALDLAD